MFTQGLSLSLPLLPTDPPYPMAEAIATMPLENKTLVLTWRQPDNIFMESEFTYNITALLVATGHVLDQRLVTLESMKSPREVYNFTEVELCEDIRFTLTQVGDCREQHVSTFLPICKEVFLCIQCMMTKKYISSRSIYF